METIKYEPKHEQPDPVKTLLSHLQTAYSALNQARSIVDYEVVGEFDKKKRKVMVSYLRLSLLEAEKILHTITGKEYF